MVKIGDKIRLTNTDYEEYEKLKNKTFKVTDVAYNRDEHPGYDESIGGPLITCDGLDFCLYEYEFDVVERKENDILRKTRI